MVGEKQRDRNFHPDHLRPDTFYRFYYETFQGKVQKEMGKFLRMELGKELDPKGTLWLWFEVAAGNVPWEVPSILKVEEV